ncbi:MAG: M48 family metalloprotease [Alphaproteobacteria bacterium]|nr:M48 family metalloprotease [Alphaproteobacteria bacterium]
MKRVLALTLMLLTGAARAQPDADSDEAGLAMQVAKAEDNIRNSAALVRDPALNDYVHGIVCRLTPCAALRVYLVGSPGLNVFALPNGALVVWTGALLRAQDEAQLAHLLAHEIAHYQNKDSLDLYHRMLDTSGVVALLGVAAAGAGIGFVGTPASMAALGAKYSHSDAQERDADRAGMAMAAAAGYDPAAALAVWRAADADFLKVHPWSEDRLAALQDLAHGTGKTGAENHRAVTAPYLERWVGEELRRDIDTVALFIRLAASGRGLCRYGLGEAYRKRGAPGDAVLAASWFRAALAAPDSPPLAWRGLGLLALQNGDKPAARAAFAQYRVMAPDADDKAMIDYYLTQL